MYSIAAVAASGMFIAAGWRSKHTKSLAAAHGRNGLPLDPLWGEAEVNVDAPESQADVGAAVRLALKRLGPVMAAQSVDAEIATPSGLLVRMRSAVLADLLEELLAATIHGAPASRLLITAAAYGDRVYIRITDDMPGADAAVRLGGIRGVMERVALRGGVLDINVRPIEGTTVTLRLAAVLEERQDHKERPLSERPIGRAASVAGFSTN